MMENNFKKRQTWTETTIDDREFIIESYDPMIGNYILAQLFAFILPFGISDMIAERVPGSEKVVKNSNSKMMPRDDFIQLQKDILSTVYEQYPSGNRSPVVRENGTYGVEDVSSMLCIRLIIASLAFNYKDFFDAVPSLTSLTEM